VESDDIVTRLRESIADGRGIWDGDAKEAADEIERLRAELVMAVKWRDNYKLAWQRGTKPLEEYGNR